MEAGQASDRVAAPAGSEVDLGHWCRSAIFIGVFLLVWISTAPFKGSYQVSAEESSNLVNQIAFSLFAVLSIAAAANSVGRVAARAYLRPTWLI